MSAVKPPVARKVESVVQRHGQEFHDPYAWMKDKDDPAVLAHLEAENAYADAMMQGSAERRERLYREMRGRIQETDLSVPVIIGDWEYYSRTETGKQYQTHCRRPVDPADQRRDAPDAKHPAPDEQIMLDENLLAEGHDYFHLGAFEISPDQHLLAYAVDHDGGEVYTLQVLDLRTGELLPDRIEGAYDSIEWANDNRTLFYNTLDDSHRPWRIWRHRIGEPQQDDRLMFEEADQRFFVQVYKTKSKRFLGVHLSSHTTSEVHLLDANHPEGDFELLQERKQDVEYSVEHSGDRLYILTNEGAVNFRLEAAPIDDPSPANRVELIPHSLEVKLDDIEAFRNHIAVVQRRHGLRGVRVYRIAGWEGHDIEFPEPVHTVRTGGNPEFDTTTLRYVYSSPITPASVYDYDMQTGQAELRKRTPVLGGYDPDDYACERLNAIAADGTPVPISLVYRRGREVEDGGPLILYGYGSYGACVEPAFDSSRLCLLDRGVAYAIAHIRGGGEMGRPWYESGKLERKMNTFTDFIACAEHLIEQGWTTPGQLAIRGGSAGGLLVGAAINLRPELFRACVAKVPFVDVVNTMFDPDLPLTVIEYEEWGNPNDEDSHAQMLAYSPYDNVRPRAYPDLLVTAGLNDPRVGFWEPAKWAARLREMRTDDGVLLLKTEMGAGHSGPSGRYDYLKELALEFAFVLERLGVAEPTAASTT